MIVKAIKQLFQPSFKHEAHDAYLRIVEQSRKPWFYKELTIPDTLDGRFDVTILHMFLVIHRLRRERSEEAAHFIRSLSEVFFADMDRNLREMGVGDTGVGHRIKKMVEAFYGRLQAYEQSFLKSQEFSKSLQRNLYREEPIDIKKLQELSEYARRNAGHLGILPADDILKGQLTFVD